MLPETLEYRGYKLFIFAPFRGHGLWRAVIQAMGDSPQISFFRAGPTREEVLGEAMGVIDAKLAE